MMIRISKNTQSPRFTPTLLKECVGGESIGKKIHPPGESGVNLFITHHNCWQIDSPPEVNLSKKKIHPPPLKNRIGVNLLPLIKSISYEICNDVVLFN